MRGRRARGRSARRQAEPDDSGGGRAARAAGIPKGGWIPLGLLTEDGPWPKFADLYGARELPTASDPARTFANARDSDGTLWFGAAGSPGAVTTFRACP